MDNTNNNQGSGDQPAMPAMPMGDASMPVQAPQDPGTAGGMGMPQTPPADPGMGIPATPQADPGLGSGMGMPPADPAPMGGGMEMPPSAPMETPVNPAPDTSGNAGGTVV